MIKFYNIRSGESRVALGEPHIAALWASSDRSPNITQGQDFGWRLSPETVVEMQRIMKDPRQMESIAVQAGIIPDNVTETDVLNHISNREDKKSQGMQTAQSDFLSEYEAEIKRLKGTGESETGESITPEEPVEEAPRVPQPAPVARPVVSEPVIKSVVEGPKEVPADSPALSLEVDENMSRAKLETVAKDLLIDAPSGYQNKGKLVEAIKAKQAKTY